MVIERKTLRTQVRDELLQRMRSGAVLPGESINEVHLATELGVSRTPLREALIGLESEGQITSENGKGFRFVKLTAAEFSELGPIIAALESLALELTPAEVRRTLGTRLRILAEDFSSDTAAHSVVTERDDEWHGVLLSGCPNQSLLDLTESVRGRIHRYESLAVTDESMIERVAEEHLRVAQCLEDGDLAGAQTALTTNWINGVSRILSQASLSYITP